MEHTSAFTSIIDSQLLPMRVGIVFLMGCCILAAYCTNKRKNIEKERISNASQRLPGTL